MKNTCHLIFCEGVGVARSCLRSVNRHFLRDGCQTFHIVIAIQDLIASLVCHRVQHASLCHPLISRFVAQSICRGQRIVSVFCVRLADFHIRIRIFRICLLLFLDISIGIVCEVIDHFLSGGRFCHIFLGVILILKFFSFYIGHADQIVIVIVLKLSTLSIGIRHRDHVSFFIVGKTCSILFFV